MRTRHAAADYYRTLRIGPNASAEEIKAAFRRLSKKYHPDANPGSAHRAGERFKEINEAYSVLSDPEQRREYDRMRFSAENAGSSYARSAGTTFTGNGYSAAGGGRPYTGSTSDAGRKSGGNRRTSLASPGWQLAARLIDLAIVVAVVLTARALGAEADTAGKMFAWCVLVGFAYETFLVGLLGRTLGMMAVRVKVVRADGGKPGWRQAGMRMSLALPGLLAVTPTGDLLSLGFMILLGASALRFWMSRRGNRPGGLSRSAQVFGLGLMIFALITYFWVLLSFVALVYVLSPMFTQNGRAVHDQLAGVVIVKA